MDGEVTPLGTMQFAIQQPIC